VATIRVETILALAVLLLLLLQLPRLDDPPETRLVGGEITKVEDIKGAALYVEEETIGAALLYVSELRMHEDPSGVAYVTRLDGTLVSQSGTLERFHTDVTARASALGWTPVTELDDLISPGSGRGRHPFEFRRLRLRKIIYEGRDILFAVGRIEGRDLATGQVVSEEYDASAACAAIPYLEPVHVIDSSGNTESFWALTGTLCWRSERTLAQAGLPAWTAGYQAVN